MKSCKIILISTALMLQTAISYSASPQTGTVIPSSGSSKTESAVIFTTTYSDPDGWQNIKECFFSISPTSNNNGFFRGYYNRNLNLLYIANDTIKNRIGGFTPGSSNIIENSFVKLDCSGVTVSGSGTTLTVKWKIIFKSNAGSSKTRTTALFATDDTGGSTGWVSKGSYIIELPDIAELKSVSLAPPTVESYQYCKLRGYTKEKLVDGISFDTGNNSGLAYPGGMWHETATGKYIVFDYVVDLKSYHNIEKVKFHWGYFGDHPSYTYINSWKFYYMDKVSGNWVEYPAASGSSKPMSKITERSASLITDMVRIKAWGVNWSGMYELEAFGQPQDVTPPSGTVKINNNAQYTKSSSVTLSLSALDSGTGVSHMKFSNDNVTYSAPEIYSATKSWTLSSGDGIKTVYVKFRDTTGNWSSAYSDTIIFDAIAPGVPIIDPVTSPVNTSTQTITGTKTTDAVSVSVSCPTAVAGQVTYPTSTTWSCQLTGLTSGSNNISAYASDAAGNNSAASTVTIILDNTPPGGAISINNGDQYTDQSDVVLTLSGTDPGSGVSHMKFSNDNVTYSAPEIYSATKSWTLSSGDGIKTVYVKFRDMAGNWSGAYPDNIILDTIPPAGPVINALVSPTTVNSQTISGTRTVDTVSVSVSCPTAAVRQVTYPGTTTWSCLIENLTMGSNIISVTAMDAAGNRSSSVSGTILLNQLLSVSAEPNLWDIGATEVNKVITMNSGAKITVINDGTGPQTYDLKLIDPAGWTASAAPGKEQYVLNGIFCGLSDIPQAGSFNQGTLSEDVITQTAKKATGTVFSYNQGTANGIAVPAGNARALYLQFKSPTITGKKGGQDIEVVVSAQIP